MKVQQLDHLNLTVRDFDETAAWYGRVFGFEIVEDDVDASGLRWGVLRSGEAMLCIYQHPELQGVERTGHRVKHFGLRIAERDEWERTVEREQLDLHYGGLVEWPHSDAWYVTDPSGHEIEVVLWRDGRIAFSR